MSERGHQVSVSTSSIERAWVAAWVAVPKLPEKVGMQLASLLCWQTFLVVGATVGAVAAAHLINPVLGLAIDVVVAGIAIGLLGAEAITAARELIAFWSAAQAARTPAQVDHAATLFAAVVSRVGVDALLALVAHRTLPRSAVTRATTSEVLTSRWLRLIDALDLAVPPNRGALWSRVTEDVAAAAAKRAGRTILNDTPGYRVFKRAYDGEFLTQKTALTADLWEALSRRFAQGLQGTVEVYTDMPKLRAAVRDGRQSAAASNAAHAPISGPRLPNRSGKLPLPGSAEQRQLLPQVLNELDAITDLMRQNDRITGVTIVDVVSGDRTLITRDLVREYTRSVH